MDRGVGTLIMITGVVLVVIGALVWSGAFGWFGRLPGDIRIERESTQVFIPITSMIVASGALTVIVNVILRLLR